jgi:hypothetical protein
LILEVGTSTPATAKLVQWLDAQIPLYRGMRDSGKWAAMLALAYSQLFGLGAAFILTWIRDHRPRRIREEWANGIAIGVLIALPLYYGNGLLFGMHGEIKPSQYPAGWYAADQQLLRDPHPGRATFLPWHLYESLSFVQNENQVIASPAPTFFSIPVVTDLDLQVSGVAPPTDPDQVAISRLVTAGATGDWGRQLAALGVKYVLVAREVDWQAYGFLAQQPGLSLVRDYGSILLYRNSFMT